MMIDSIKVDRLYLKVAEQILDYIRAENIEPDQRLPSERDLASRFGEESLADSFKSVARYSNFFERRVGPQ